jgi:hypothetical protein
MAHDPLKITIDQAGVETREAWSRSYSPERNQQAIEQIREAPIEFRISHLAARLFFRGIYFPQMGTAAWIKLLFQNRKPIISLTFEGLRTWRAARRRQKISRHELHARTGT